MASSLTFKYLSIFCVLLLFLRIARCENVVPETPSANEVVPVDKPYFIIWDKSEAPTAVSVFINLNHAGNSIGNLTSSTPNNGSYMWIPDPVFADSDNYFITICPIDDPEAGCGVTEAGRFSFAATSSSSITSNPSNPSSATKTDQSTSNTQNPTTSSTPKTSTTPTNSPAPTTSSTSSVPTSSLSQPSTSKAAVSQGVPVKVVIAIAIVIPLFVISVASLIFFLVWKRYMSKQTRTTNPDFHGAAVPGGEYSKPELPDRTAGADMGEVYSHSNWGGNTRPYELEQSHLLPSELEQSQPRPSELGDSR